MSDPEKAETKKKLAEALEECLKSEALEDVTVKDVAAASGLSRQTFYRHFKDIYDLIDWTLSEKMEESRNAFWINKDFHDVMLDQLLLLKKYRRFYREAFAMRGVNSFYRSQLDFLVRTSRIYVGEKRLTEKLIFEIEFFWSGALQMMISWINSDMSRTPEEMTEFLYSCMPEEMKAYYR